MRIASTEGLDLTYSLEVSRRMQRIQQRWTEGRHTKARWQIIRDAYSLKLPDILQTGCDPYFLQWDMTPIEWYAWHDIRGLGLKLYPQFPAGRYFIDFADPVLQIGVELDGREFHAEARDRRRDEELWALGWRIFRIPGRESLPSRDGYPWESDDWPSLDELEKRNQYFAWAMRWSEGFFHALHAFYYARRARPDGYALYAAEHVLDGHRYVDFPLALDVEELDG